MGTSDRTDRDELEAQLKEIQEKMDNFSSILEKFGFDIITKLGLSTSKIKMLNEKVEEMNKATIDIKGLLPQLNRVIENQNKLTSELELIKTLVQKSMASGGVSVPMLSEIERDSSVSSDKKTLAGRLADLGKEIQEIKDLPTLTKKLEDLRTEIYEITGGHKVLYEMLQTITRLKKQDESFDQLKDVVKEKLEFWANKL